MTIKFSECWTDQYISNRQHNGDWPYYFHIDVTDMDSACGDVSKGKWMVSLNVVSVGAAGSKNLKSAFESAGFIEDGKSLYKAVKEFKARTGKHYEAALHHELSQYGVHACLFHELGNNLSKLLKETREQAKQIEFLFGFYMDKRLNGLGSNGWDFIKGDVMAGLDRWKASQAA